MIRGMYTAASGMKALERRQESLSNDLANLRTPGYKQNETVIRSFPEQLIASIRDQGGMNIQGWPATGPNSAVLGRLNTGVYMSEGMINFRQGDIEQTDYPFDFALTDNLQPGPDAPVINGQPVRPVLFYSVALLQADEELDEVPEESIRYTRNGSFAVNEAGYLVTADGYHVLDNENRPIRINGLENAFGDIIDVGNELRVGPNGELMRPDPSGVEGAYVPLDPFAAPDEFSRIGLRIITNPNELIREGNNVYRYEGGEVPADVSADPEQAGFFAVRQGWVERSNVDATRVMTDMMSVLRAYEANQRVISTLDGTLEKAVNEIGRVT